MPPIIRHAFLALVATLALGLASKAGAADPLPSWNEGPTKQSIVDFVTRVTKEGGPDYVAPEDRVATFDNDGTLWVEQPIYTQFMFAIDRVKATSNEHPEWKDKEPFKSVLAGDMKAVAAMGEKGMLEIMAVTHSGMTTADFRETVDQWITTAKHPRFKVLYTDLVYQPMLELLDYLRANDFQVFIVSGGGVEFMRSFTRKSYGVPPWQVVGSLDVTKYGMWDASPILVKESKVFFVDDGPGKPEGINHFIGAQQSSLSAIRTATRRCWNGPRPASGSASWGSCITPTRCANMPMTAIQASANSTRRSTRRLIEGGPWST